MRKRGAGGALKKQAIEDGAGGVQFKPTSGTSKAKASSSSRRWGAAKAKAAEAPSKKVRTELARGLSIADQVEAIIAPGAKRFRSGKAGRPVGQPAITQTARVGKA